MPTTMTLDGVRMNNLLSFLKNLGPRPRPLGDVWDDAAGTSSNFAADFTTAALGWGILAFALGTAAIRGSRAVKRHL